ncbi:hypothetical protein FGIG_10982 [Fasciola gigantica]|uniref:Uncharacterized protein n=1 Tax=Fasciola gigantica TaxID=46835 RepID=A0A504YMB1_FASGI|nr:hypothetical protein FGIG_10982 [Fasciola gigantica]
MGNSEVTTLDDRIGVLVHGRKEDVPQNAILLSSSDLYHIRRSQIFSWKNRSEVWPFIYGPQLAATTVCISSFLVNINARQMFNLQAQRFFWSTALPTIVFPIVSFWTAYEALVIRPILTRSPQTWNEDGPCDVCLEVRASVVQSPAGLRSDAITTSQTEAPSKRPRIDCSAEATVDELNPDLVAIVTPEIECQHAHYIPGWSVLIVRGPFPNMFHQKLTIIKPLPTHLTHLKRIDTCRKLTNHSDPNMAAITVRLNTRGCRNCHSAIEQLLVSHAGIKPTDVDGYSDIICVPRKSAGRATSLLLAAGWEACVEHREESDGEESDDKNVSGDHDDLLFVQWDSPAKDGTASPAGLRSDAITTFRRSTI